METLRYTVFTVDTVSRLRWQIPFWIKCYLPGWLLFRVSPTPLWRRIGQQFLSQKFPFVDRHPPPAWMFQGWAHVRWSWSEWDWGVKASMEGIPESGQLFLFRNDNATQPKIGANIREKPESQETWVMGEKNHCSLSKWNRVPHKHFWSSFL